MSSLNVLQEGVVRWEDSALELVIAVDAQRIPRLSLTPSIADGAPRARVPAVAADPAHRGLPLIDVMIAGTGRSWAGLRYSESAVGAQLRYVEHRAERDGLFNTLTVRLHDPDSGLAAIVTYARLDDAGVLRSRTRLVNEGDAALTVHSVSSLLLGGLAGVDGDLRDVEILWAENDWQAESRWHGRRFRDAIPQLSTVLEDGRSRGRFALTSVGSWSSGTYLPMGAAVNRRSGHTLLWQIEHNGAWHWQVGEHLGAGPSLSYVSLLGPTDIDHQWRVTLAPGESFETVPAAIAVSDGGLDDAVARLTRYRRAIRREHDDLRTLPVIFNDYLNTVRADPTTERLLPLVAAAAAAGAECFCIDAGWYAEPAEDWWDGVGEWRPSETRFTGGLQRVIEQIRTEAMVPGIWIEPEVVGVRSPVADVLPNEAFFMRDGTRVVEQGRYHLDLRHPAAREHLDSTVRFLVDELGVGYIKMDYNIDVAPGTDVGGVPAGAGLLGHNRALLDWIESVLDRHPGLTLEACSSGAMRCDYGTLSRFQLQSTSDQEDPLSYPPIAAAAPLAIAPEQAAVWTSVQPEMSDDLIAFTLCGALLQRMQLSGNIDAMTLAQFALVSRAVEVYKDIRHDIAAGVPFWPLGLPSWTDGWMALGLRAPETTYLIVWRRPQPSCEASRDTVTLAVTPLAHDDTPHVRYASDGATVQTTASGELEVSLPRAPGACLIAIGAAQTG
jgi:alpha-galactosidase